MGMCPVATIHAPFDPLSSGNKGWVKQNASYQWDFWPKETGTVTLTFKKYYYSNSTARNPDGSSPWKDRVEEIHFTIQVVDSANN